MVQRKRRRSWCARAACSAATVRCVWRCASSATTTPTVTTAPTKPTATPTAPAFTRCSSLLFVFCFHRGISLLCGCHQAPRPLERNLFFFFYMFTLIDGLLQGSGNRKETVIFFSKFVFLAFVEPLVALLGCLLCCLAFGNL